MSCDETSRAISAENHKKSNENKDMTPIYITADMVEPHLEWSAVADAIAQGHKLARADVGDIFNKRGGETLLTRAAWIDGLGIAVKSMSVFPGNTDQPSINGAMILFEDKHGAVLAIVDGILATKWKTAGDSLLGARMLARKDAQKLLIVGAGAVARSLTEAYRSHWPDIDISIWNRTKASAEALATQTGARVAEDLPSAVGDTDILACATMALDPIIQGAWLTQGTHVDLIGAFRADMREVDDTTLTRASIFVDSRDTTMGHIGELKIPLEAGTIQPSDIRGDFYDLVAGRAGRANDDEITLFKNGGGAHLDLMTARVIYETCLALQS
jgi:ornithine cyclodeaminase